MLGKTRETRGPRQPIGERVHGWLAEAENQQFRLGKWRFWFIYVASLQLLNAALTTLIFRTAGNLQNYMGEILLGVGVLIGWIAVGCLHYSDSPNRQLARGVSKLDSATLLFVTAHFALCCWVYGHVAILKNADADYKAQATAYNEHAQKVSSDNVKIAEASERIAAEGTKRAKLENDTTYQWRKGMEAGGMRRSAPQPAQTGVAPNAPSLSTAPIELEKPDKPAESSAAYITRWDAWIRLANLGELLLVAITLIYIRNQTAASNTAPPGQAAPAPQPQLYDAWAPQPKRQVGYVTSQDRPKEREPWD